MVGNSYRVLYRLAVHHHLLLTSSVKPTTETIIIVVANTVVFVESLSFPPSSTMPQSNVWLITGASRGLGFDMAKIALEAGHKVIACYRGEKPQDTSKWDELETLGGVWTQLDVSSEDAESKVKALVAEHGQIDVLVNNAGYAILGSIEDVP